MPDDAASILAPADPTWNPQPGNVGALAAPPGALPPGTAQPVIPPQQAAQTDPNAQPVSMPGMAPQMPQPTPSQVSPGTPPDDGSSSHLDWLKRTLNTVGSILGGSETWHVTKDAQGNVQVQADPSTAKEKWGRVAAAAIGGAARGLAAGQGPGGGARAVGAGADFGLQASQQQKTTAQQDATAEQTRQMANANNAILHQKGYQTMLESRSLGMKVSQEDADQLNQYDDIADDPNAKDYGVVSGWDDLKKIKDDPDFLQHHTDGSLQVVPVRGKDGQLSLHAVATDPSNANSPVAKGTMMPRIDIDPKTGKVSLAQDPVAAGTKNGVYRAARTSVLMSYFDTKNKQMTAQAAEDRANKETIPNTSGKAFGMANSTQDPAEKANYTALGNRLLANETALRKAGRNVTGPNANTPSSPAAISNWGDLLADPKQNATLNEVKPVDRPAVIADMKARGLSIAKPLTAKEVDRADLATNSLGNFASAEQIWQKRPDLFGPAGYGKSKMQLALQGGDPDALAFQTAISLANLPAVGIHGVRGRWALEDLAKYDSNLWLNHDAMGRVLGEIHRSVKEFAGAGGRQLEEPPAALGGATAAQAPKPGAAATPQTKPAGQPASIANDPSWASDGKGNYQHYNGTTWIKATPPTS